MKSLLPLSLLLACLAFSACSKSTPTKEPELGATAYSMSDADKRLVAEKFPGVTPSPTGVISIIRQPGEGKTPRHGSVVRVHYQLHLLNGTLVEDSRKLGEPLRIPIGVGRVIKGWDEAILEMKKGEHRTLVIPHYLGYGVTGNPPAIPPYATLVFDVELLDFQ